MLNLRYVALLKRVYSPKQMINWMRLSTHYVTDSVNMFNECKVNFKQSKIQKLFPNHVANEFAMIHLYGPKIEPVLNENYEKIIASNQEGDEAQLMRLFDEQGQTFVFWPNRPHSVISYSESLNERNIVPGVQLEKVVL